MHYSVGSYFLSLDIANFKCKIFSFICKNTHNNIYIVIKI